MAVMWFFRKIWRDNKGVAAIEFAFVAPVIFLAIIGALELGTIMISTILIEGALGEASRQGLTGYTKSGTERKDYIVQIIKDKTFNMVKIDNLKITHKVYKKFGDVSSAESYVDTDGDGQYTPGIDTFTDINCNNTWDADMGTSGVGGPGDIVVYDIEYEAKFMTSFFSRFMGNDGKIKLAAHTAVKNEPFGAEECTAKTISPAATGGTP